MKHHRLNRRPQIDDPAFALEFEASGTRPSLRQVAADIASASRAFYPIVPYGEACRLSRQWHAVAELLEGMGCVRLGIAQQSVMPHVVDVLRCPWEHEHRGGFVVGAFARAPHFLDSFQGTYSCPFCGDRRKYIDLVGLLDKDWDAQYQEEATCDPLLAS